MLHVEINFRKRCLNALENLEVSEDSMRRSLTAVKFFPHFTLVETPVERWARDRTSIDRRAEGPGPHVVAGHVQIVQYWPSPVGDNDGKAMATRLKEVVCKSIGLPGTALALRFTNISCHGDVVTYISDQDVRVLASCIRILAPLRFNTDTAFAERLFAAGCDGIQFSVLGNEEYSGTDASKTVHPLRLSPGVTGLHLNGAYAAQTMGLAMDNDIIVSDATVNIYEFRYDPVSITAHAIPYHCPIRILDRSPDHLFRNLHEFGAPWLNPLVSSNGRLYPGAKGVLRQFPMMRRFHCQAQLSDSLAVGLPALAKCLSQGFMALEELILNLSSELLDHQKPGAPHLRTQVKGWSQYAAIFQVKRVIVVWQGDTDGLSPGVRLFLEETKREMRECGITDMVYDVSGAGGITEERLPWSAFGEFIVNR
ncbi:hypothetical protein HDU93_001446 [Gonapodya sp. JEL0774]|nr:hypothetical protein HDU93_001446 [Gonapodya sp. JEL0774]